MRVNLLKTKRRQSRSMGLSDDGSGDPDQPPKKVDDESEESDQPPPKKSEYDDRLVFKFNARFRIKARDIEPIQKSLIDWAHKWQLDL